MPVERVTVTTGDTRRFGYGVGHVRLAGRGDERQRGGRWRPARCGRRRCGSPPSALGASDGRAGDRRRRGRGARVRPGRAAIAAGHGRGALQPAAVRLRRGGQAGHAVRRSAGAATGRRCPRARSRAWRRPASTRRSAPRSPTARTPRSSRPTRRPPRSGSCGTAWCTTAARLINPMIVEGQVHGGVAQGVGGALYERIVYDEHGQLLNASFMDFLMPYASEVPDGRDRPPGDALAAEPAGHQGRRRGRGDPRARGARRGDRGRRGLPRSTAMPISPSRAVGAAPRGTRPARCRARGEESTDEGRPARPSCTRPATRSTRRSTTRPCWSARSPAASGSSRSARTPTGRPSPPGVASIKGTFDGEVRLSRPAAPALVHAARLRRRRARHGQRRRPGDARADAATARPC